MDYRDSTQTKLSDILPRGDKSFRFLYEYDFGDSWQHEILFEGRVEAKPGQVYPICHGGHRACPPEDVGGIWGYADFLEAIADPDHDQHHEMKEWVGGKFDPEEFFPAMATLRMQSRSPAWLKRPMNCGDQARAYTRTGFSSLTATRIGAAMKKLTPVFVVEDIEPCLDFWIGRAGLRGSSEDSRRRLAGIRHPHQRERGDHVPEQGKPEKGYPGACRRAAWIAQCDLYRGLGSG